MSRLLTCLALLAPLTALAEDPVDLRERQLELLRAEVGGQLQLQAAELLDELVYGWTQTAPFDVDTPVILAGVSVPVSLGTGLEAYLENHFAGLALKNPRSHVQLVHCPACSAWVFRSGATGTTVSRGYDDPDALSKAGLASGAKHALFLDFEAEGASLVLRARVTTLDSTLRLVFARTLTTATSAPAMLRESERLTSVAQARKEYLDALGGRSLFVVPIRVGLRSYGTGERTNIASAPFLWVTAGFEAAFSQARAWTASLNAGFSWLPQSHVAVLAQGRIARLLTGNTTSLTWPDLYGFIGAGVMFGQGRGMLLFRDTNPTIDDILNVSTNNEPRSTLGLLTIGLELRVKNRIGVIVFLETLPGLTTTDNIGDVLNIGLRFQSFGVEVAFCF